MNIKNDIIIEIVESLKSIDPYMIILFGSQALNRENENSDLDIIVILDDPDIPNNYSDRMNRKLIVRRAIYDLSKKMQIDLVVYTRGEFEKISELKTSFAEEIKTSGVILYEKAG